jgi:SAM-dependent methyltransferase
MPIPTVDLNAVKLAQQQMWTAGDYGRVGTTLVLMGELLCEAADLRAGWRVLDVATGSGNTALSAARRHCRVSGIDYVPELLEQARARAAAERLDVEFTTGDAEQIPFPDRSFDAVLSTIGVMFAPDHARAAAELVRVARPGATIGLTAWTPDGFVGEMFALYARYVPAPPGLPSPLLWGTEAHLRHLFGDALRTLRTTLRSQVFRYPSPASYVEFYRTWFGPTMRTFAALDGAGRTALASEFEALVRRHNRAGDGTLILAADYLEAVAAVAGTAS